MRKLKMFSRRQGLVGYLACPSVTAAKRSPRRGCLASRPPRPHSPAPFRPRHRHSLASPPRCRRQSRRCSGWMSAGASVRQQRPRLRPRTPSASSRHPRPARRWGRAPLQGCGPGRVGGRGTRMGRGPGRGGPRPRRSRGWGCPAAGGPARSIGRAAGPARSNTRSAPLEMKQPNRVDTENRGWAFQVTSSVSASSSSSPPFASGVGYCGIQFCCAAGEKGAPMFRPPVGVCE